MFRASGTQPATTAPAPARKAQLLVWCLAVLAVLGAAWVATPSHERTLNSPSVAASRVALQDAPAATSQPLAAGGAVYAIGEEGNGGPESEANCTTSYLKADAPKLPAQRWGDFSLDKESEGRVPDVMKSFTTAIATGGFLLANLLWTCLLYLIRLGTSADFLCVVGVPINQGAAALAGDLKGVTIIIVAIALFRAGMKLFRGRQKEAASLVMASVIGMAGVFAVGNISRSAAEANVVGTNTLPGIAADIQSKLNATSDGLVSLSSNLGIEEGAPGGPSANDRDNPDCDTYVTQIHASYSEANAASGRFGASSANGVASRLWESTFLSSWAAAQFGPSAPNNNSANRAYCHLLDLNAGISREDQNDLLVASGGVAITGNAVRMLGPINDSDDRRKVTIAWAACRVVDGKWTAARQWSPTLKVKGADAGIGEDDNTFDQICPGVFAEGGAGGYKNPESLSERLKQSGDNLYFKKGENYDQAFGECESITYTETPTLQGCKGPRNFVKAYMGGNGGQRLTESVVALFTAGIFLFALGGLALGTLLAQVMLMMLLILLPVTLTMCAMKASGGPKLLRLTGTSLVTAFLFSMLLAIMSSLIGVGNVIVSALTDNGYGVGFFGRVLQAFIPIAILLLMKKILQAAGMGDITKASGSLGFMASAAARATGDKSIESRVRGGLAGAGGALGKIPLGKDKHGNARTLRTLDDKSFESRALGLAAFGGKKTLTAAEAARDYTKAGQAAKKLTHRAEEGASDVVEAARTSRWLRRAALFGAVGTAGAASGGALLLPAALAAGVGVLGGKGMQQRLANRRSDRMALARGDDEGESLVDAGIMKPRYFDRDDARARRLHKDEQRKYQNLTVDDPEKAREFSEARTFETLDQIIRATYKGEALEGLLDGFRLDSRDLEAARKTLADQIGVAAEHIVVTDQGLAVLGDKVRYFDKDMKRQVVAPGTSPEAARSPEFWLPETDRKRRGAEIPPPKASEEEIEAANRAYAARITSAIASRGWVVDGQPVDMLKAQFGLNLENAADVARINAWFGGAKDPEFDSFFIRQANPNDERARTIAAQAWRPGITPEEGRAERAAQEEAARAAAESARIAREAAEERARMEKEALEAKLAADKAAEEARRAQEQAAADERQRSAADAASARERAANEAAERAAAAAEAAATAAATAAAAVAGGGVGGAAAAAAAAAGAAVGGAAGSAAGGSGGAGGGDAFREEMAATRREMAEGLARVTQATTSIADLVGQMDTAARSGNSELQKQLASSIAQRAQESAEQVEYLKGIKDSVETASRVAQTGARNSQEIIEERFNQSMAEAERLRAAVVGAIAQMNQTGDPAPVAQLNAQLGALVQQLNTGFQQQASFLEDIARHTAEVARREEAKRGSQVDPEDRGMLSSKDLAARRSEPGSP